MENKAEITEFKIVPNGPLHIKGSFVLKGTNGQIYDVKDETWLCRCGGSANKPFCDGSHKNIGVRD